MQSFVLFYLANILMNLDERCRKKMEPMKEMERTMTTNGSLLIWVQRERQRGERYMGSHSETGRVVSV